ncbi:MAG: hypothetical protein Q8936_17270 [Bacillota bacterium]|nr:hypothetical protein [Bacillota bacterium]
MKKPISVKVVHITILIKLVLLLLLLSLTILSFNLNNDIGGGLRDGLRISNLDAYTISAYITENIGIPLILVVLSLIFLTKRMYVALIVILSLQLASSIRSIPSLFLVLAQLLIITLNSNAKNYFKPINKASD